MKNLNMDWLDKEFSDFDPDNERDYAGFNSFVASFPQWVQDHFRIEPLVHQTLNVCFRGRKTIAQTTDILARVFLQAKLHVDQIHTDHMMLCMQPHPLP